MLVVTALVAICAAWVGVRARTARLRAEICRQFRGSNPEIVWQGVKPIEIYFSDLAGPQKLADDEMEGLGHLDSLVTLSIWGATDLTDDGLRHITCLDNLRALRIADAPITDAGLAHIAQLTGLRTLILKDTAVTDAGLAHLGSLKRLLLLDLENCVGVTDDGLTHLYELRALESVNLNGCSVTVAGVERLKDALPNADISAVIRRE